MEVLLLVAHADDETIGAGGLIPLLIEKGHKVSVVMASDGDLRARGEGIDNLPDFYRACKFYSIERITCLGFRDQYFDTYPVADIANKAAEAAGDPDLIISHSDHDLNRDHRIMNEVAKIIGRPNHKPVSILGMEIAGTAAWNSRHFKPDLYIDITKAIHKKQQAFSLYANEQREFPHPYSSRGLGVVAAARGLESGSEYAEAYQAIRLHHAHMGF